MNTFRESKFSKIQWAETQHCGDYVVTPVLRAYTFSCPALHFRLKWSHPLAVLVSGDDGHKIMPVKDMTRRIQILVWSLAILISLLALVIRSRRFADGSIKPVS